MYLYIVPISLFFTLAGVVSMVRGDPLSFDFTLAGVVSMVRGAVGPPIRGRLIW